jgi:DNA gyrase/topoisomerase IV subunit A
LPNGGKIDENSLEDTTPRKRGGQGVTAMNTECIIGAISVESISEILMITSNGQAVRCPVNNIRETNRGPEGVKLVNLSGKDKLIAVSEVIELDEGDIDQQELQNSDENAESKSVENSGVEQVDSTE